MKLRVPVAKNVNLSRALIVVFVQGPKSGGIEEAAVMKIGKRQLAKDIGVREGKDM